MKTLWQKLSAAEVPESGKDKTVLPLVLENWKCIRNFKAFSHLPYTTNLLLKHRDKNMENDINKSIKIK